MNELTVSSENRLDDILIDIEFKSLIPPLTKEEHDGLEESILTEGCRDAIVLWNNVIVDGHNRYMICMDHGIPFRTVQKEFADRNDAIVWIIKNQFGRRNLPAYERARLALRLKPVIAERAKGQQVRTSENRVSQISAKQAIDTRQELAAVAGVSHDTIAKVEKIEAKAIPEIKEKLRNGGISINQASQVTKLSQEQQEEISKQIDNATEEVEESTTPKETIKKIIKMPHVAFNSGNNEWYTPSDIIEAARKTMGSIDLDPATSETAQKVVNAKEYYTADTNGLNKNWHGNVWMNPPYASELITKFIDKLVNELPNINQAMVLVNNATETEWFSKLIADAKAVCFPKSRVKFYMPDGKTGAPLQGQAILYYGKNVNEFIRNFSDKGWCAIPQ